MIVFITYDTYQVEGDDEPYDAPTGLFSDAQYAKMLVERTHPDIEWVRVEDPDNLRYMWYGYELYRRTVKIVPFAVNSFFSSEGVVLGTY